MTDSTVRGARQRPAAAGSMVSTGPLAANLRRLRQRAGLSVVELSRRADIGRATLTQLEAGSGNPTLETLYALAGQLGVPLADLIAEAEPTAAPVLHRFADGAATRGQVVQAWLLHRRRLTADTIEIYSIVMHPGPVQRSAGHVVGTREHLQLHAGAESDVRVGPADQPITLRPGDYADYPADVPHVYQVDGQAAGRGAPPVTASLTIITPAG
ncbi:helix-turn-helix domain-containing protein [Nakamurella aerolata]|nr:helix-turn-helix domain-containing protein [Nakamurella aerolata]